MCDSQTHYESVYRVLDPIRDSLLSTILIHEYASNRHLSSADGEQYLSKLFW
jgi:hypothetical protein